MAFHALLACYNVLMNRDGLPQYIKIQLDQRVPLEKIIATLKVGGWSEIDIQAALSMKQPREASPAAGLEAQSMAFFSTAEIELLYSGDEIKMP